MDLGIKWLGFTIPIAITTRQTPYYSRPGSGRCTECEESRDKVFVRWDGQPYCDRCIEFDIAEASPSDEMKREQPHPSLTPIETIYEKVKYAVNDGADLRVYEKAFS